MHADITQENWYHSTACLLMFIGSCFWDIWFQKIQRPWHLG